MKQVKKEVEVVLTQDQRVKGEDCKKDAKITVSENTAKRMKARGLIK